MTTTEVGYRVDPDALAPLDVTSRIPALRATLEREELEALLVTRLPNVRYLTGFTGSAAMLLVGAEQSVFVTDGRYGEQSHEQLGAAGVDATIAVRTVASEQLDTLAGALADTNVRRLGLEAHGVTWAQQRQFSARFVEAVADLDVVPAGNARRGAATGEGRRRDRSHPRRVRDRRRRVPVARVAARLGHHRARIRAGPRVRDA